jgi:hypothetical protein
LARQFQPKEKSEANSSQALRCRPNRHHQFEGGETAMLVRKKRLDAKKIDAALGRFEECFSQEFSLQEFVTVHFERLEKLKKKKKELHSFLISGGFDVGTYGSFSKAFQRIKRARKGKEAAIGEGN